jgi:hypothetical protein
VVTSPLKGNSDLLGIFFGLEWADAYPIIFSCWPIAWSDIDSFKPRL